MQDNQLDEPAEGIKHTRCPECGSAKILTDPQQGERFCEVCGYVLTDRAITHDPEWRAFNAQERKNRSRVGSPISYAISDKGLSTEIGNVYRESGRNLSTERKYQLLRMAKWHRRVVRSSKQRNLNTAMNILARYCDKLHIPRGIKEQAAILYRKTLKRDLVKGRSIRTLTAACLYMACRMTRTQRGLRDISDICDLDSKEIAKNYRLIYRELGLSIPRPKPQNRVPKIAARANIDQRIQMRAVEILRTAERLKVTAGKDPTGLAAAALYIACKQSDEHCTQKEIAHAAGITEVTIRNRYKGLVRNLDLNV